MKHHLFSAPLCLAALGLTANAAFADPTQLVSARDKSLYPYSANGPSVETAISADGRVVAFSSSATDLVPNDTNSRADLFIFERPTRKVYRISLAPDGSEANSQSNTPSASGTGRYIAFASMASNLVAGDTNDARDIFVYDCVAHTLSRVSVSSAGQQANAESGNPSISDDGRYITYTSSATNLVPTALGAASNVYVYDRQTHTTSLVNVNANGTPANGASGLSKISGNGRFIAYGSIASNLVDGDTNSTTDVFVYDRTTHLTTRVSLDSSGAQANGVSFDPAISTDGRYVTFTSDASNLVANDQTENDIFLRDRQTGATVRVSSDDPNGPWGAFGSTVSADGRYVAFSAYAGYPQIFLRDRVTGTLKQVTEGELVNWHSNGGLSAALSSNGQYLAFSSDSPRLVKNDGNDWDDAYYYTVQTEAIALASVPQVSSSTAPGSSTNNLFSASGRGNLVSFDSDAQLLVPNDTNSYVDSFLRNTAARTTTRVSTASDGAQGNYQAAESVVSANGRYTAFASNSDNLVPNDTNYCIDVFVKDNQTGQTERVSVASDGTEAGGDIPECDSRQPAISADGRYVSFSSQAENLAPNAEYGINVYIHDRVTGVTELISARTQPGEIEYEYAYSSSVSDDGRYVAFESADSRFTPGDTNGVSDVFVRDRQTQQTLLVSRTPTGMVGNNWSDSVAVSGNGRYIAFASSASNLVAGDTNGSGDAFVFDIQAGTVARVSLNSAGEQGNGGSGEIAISRDGSHVAFTSGATNLAPGDTNGVLDVFIRNLQTGETRIASLAANGEQGNDESLYPAISGDGTTVVFTSNATNIVPADLNDTVDVFARRLPD